LSLANHFQPLACAVKLLRTVTIAEYVAELRKNLAHGDATEHTHRPALKSLLESLSKGITATNEPKRIACGAPDFIITRKNVPLGHVETKDVGTPLEPIEHRKGPHGEQFKRYIDGLPNWILTDYLEFHWFVAGERRLTARLGTFDGKKKIQFLPDGEHDATHLLEAFFKQPALTVETAKELADRMAGMTRVVRDLIAATFQHGSIKDQKQLQNWLSAFKEVLIPDLNEAQFSDMFAQTLAYGLFAARVHSLDTPQAFSREMAAYNLPKTNPFLRKLFAEIAGVDMPDTFGWAVDDLVSLLNHADWGKVLKGFGKGKAKHDPVVHFYETFLAAYDPTMREVRGVYYTPEPVVSYIVRSVDLLLQNHFHNPKGLADEKTLILDPAVGTATFLFSVIQQIYARFAKQKGAWDGYVSEHLLNRVFGFELLMAPYAVAHLKLGMELQDTGYKFESDQRLGIYLTNTLEEAARKSHKLFAEWISEEANAAADIKRTRPILVVIGNPPYSGHSANRSRDEDGKLTFIGGLIEDYKQVDGHALGERNPKWLQDDYVKFIRFAQWRIERTGHGVLGFVTNHGYLDNPTFRGMRQSLMQSFSHIYIYDLHGNSKKKETAPDGGKDENVFDIQQGVAIILAVRDVGKEQPAQVFHADLFGLRQAKYGTLLTTDLRGTTWVNLEPTSPTYFFIPRNTDLQAEYEKGPKTTSVFPVNSVGFQTHRDYLVISPSKKELLERMQDFANPDNSDEEIRQRYFSDTKNPIYPLGDTRDWKLPRARRELQKTASLESWITECIRAPFDFQYYFHHPAAIDYGRPAIMDSLIGHDNRALLWTRPMSPKYEFAVFCAACTVDQSAVGNKSAGAGGTYVGPLYLYDSSAAIHAPQVGLGGEFTKRRINLANDLVTRISTSSSLQFADDTVEDSTDLNSAFGPKDIFDYAYAIFYAPSFRSRYAEFLRTDVPRLPLTSDRKLFAALVQKGRELTALHLMVSPKLDRFLTQFPEKGANEVGNVYYDAVERRVWVNPLQYFGGVPLEVWNFQIGGYRVCEKWLKNRKGRKLTYDDLQHWQRIVVAITETMRLTKEIDALIPGWPLP
jgi:hypothetical protein